MGKGIATALVAFVGAMLAIQAPVNARLGQMIGTWQAVFVSFTVGTICLAGIVTFSGGFSAFAHLPSNPAYLVVGGLIGMAYVSTALITVKTIGAGGLTIATLVGQIMMAVVIDHFGLLGVPKHSTGLMRIAGIILVLVGTVLVVRD